MKSRYYLLVVLFAIFSLPEQTVAQSTQELLIGTWSFNYDSSISKMEAEMKVRLETMPQTQRSSIEKAYKNRKITFYANGNYLISISDGSQAAGSWILTENGNTIKMTSSKGSAFTTILAPEAVRFFVTLVYESKKSSKILRT